MIGLSLSQVAAPSGLVLFGDDNANWFAQGYGGWFNTLDSPDWVQTFDRQVFQGRHNAGDNITFADGHTKWAKTTSLAGSGVVTTSGMTMVANVVP